MHAVSPGQRRSGDHRGFDSDAGISADEIIPQIPRRQIRKRRRGRQSDAALDANRRRHLADVDAVARRRRRDRRRRMTVVHVVLIVDVVVVWIGASGAVDGVVDSVAVGVVGVVGGIGSKMPRDDINWIT